MSSENLYWPFPKQRWFYIPKDNSLGSWELHKFEQDGASRE